ncbi:MAG: imidazole glycerol phosphate synthase subunit HisH [Labilithrix sp.]|nr:imidazole glycerol phosphate synthase subunit HisH [Labilithrix sp.]MCW5832797.1 imidazole glycerol phosphate synthase subunit HisH [Labilithrix sp.]
MTASEPTSSNGRARGQPIAVIDYGVNNVGSVLNMFRRIGVEAIAVRHATALAGSSAVVLPGIGAFDAGVKSLRERGLFEAIRASVLDARTPILGICLGMQLLGAGSEEGSLEGLGLLAATARRLTVDREIPRLKVPHMGWNRTECLDRELFAALEAPRFYFVHSYHVVCEDPSDVAARCVYGAPFTAAVRRGPIMGTQFHPEKSHRFGMRVLENFAALVAAGHHA